MTTIDEIIKELQETEYKGITFEKGVAIKDKITELNLYIKNYDMSAMFSETSTMGFSTAFEKLSKLANVAYGYGNNPLMGHLPKVRFIVVYFEGIQANFDKWLPEALNGYINSKPASRKKLTYNTQFLFDTGNRFDKDCVISYHNNLKKLQQYHELYQSFKTEDKKAELFSKACRYQGGVEMYEENKISHYVVDGDKLRLETTDFRAWEPYTSDEEVFIERVKNEPSAYIRWKPIMQTIHPEIYL